MRGGAALVHSRHLPGELLEVGRRVGGDEQLGLVAVPRQRDIARGRAPMLGVIQVRLIEGPPLPFVDRAGIAVPKILERVCIERDGAMRAAIERDGDLAAVDRLHGAGLAVVDCLRLVGAGELNPVTGREVGAAIPGFEAVIFPFQLAALLSNGADRAVELINVGVGVGEHETGFRGVGGAVNGPLRDQRGARFGLGARPLDRSLGLIDAERVIEIPFGHHLGRAPVIMLVLTAHDRQLGRAVAVLEHAEHAPALDARKLPVVADQNQLRAGGAGVGAQYRHVARVDHGGLVHHDDGAPVPSGEVVVQAQQLAVHRAGAGEAVARHVPGDGVGRGEADHLVALQLIGLADRRHREALAGAGLSVDQGKPRPCGGVAAGTGLLARDPVEFLVRQHRGQNPVADLMPAVARQAVSSAQHVLLGFEHLPGAETGRRALDLVGKVHGVWVRQHLLGELCAVELAHDLLVEHALEVATGEGRALRRHQLEHRAGVAFVDRVAELVGFRPAGAHDTAVLALVPLGPLRKLDLAPLEIVGQAGLRIDLGPHDVQVHVFLVIVGDEDRLGVAHIDRLHGVMSRLLQLLAGRSLARPPAERQVHAILDAAFGPARLVDGIEFHDPARQVGVLAALDLEAEIHAADPFDPTAVAGGLPAGFQSSRVASLPQRIADRAGDAAADLDAGDHSLSTRSKAALSWSVVRCSSSSWGIARVALATRASSLRLLPIAVSSRTSARACGFRLVPATTPAIERRRHSSRTCSLNWAPAASALFSSCRFSPGVSRMMRRRVRRSPS